MERQRKITLGIRPGLAWSRFEAFGGRSRTNITGDSLPYLTRLGDIFPVVEHNGSSQHQLGRPVIGGKRECARVQEPGNREN
jgi:hypothetical protein